MIVTGTPFAGATPPQVFYSPLAVGRPRTEKAKIRMQHPTRTLPKSRADKNLAFFAKKISYTCDARASKEDHARRLVNTIAVVGLVHSTSSYQLASPIPCYIVILDMVLL